MKLTREQVAFYALLNIQGVSTFQIAVYLSLLRDIDDLRSVLEWYHRLTELTGKFPTESDLVEKIYEVITR